MHPRHHDLPRDRIEVKFTRGVIDGSKDLFITPEGDGAILRAVWNVRLTGMMGMLGGMVAGHIKKGTKQALESIKQEVESRWTQ